ncbi:MAG: PorV/PorQ family protein [Cytophagales bacterium]
MKRLFIISLISILVLVELQAQLIPNLGGQRTGISSLTFLKNNMSPRSIAMGGFHVGIEGDAYSLYTNPASMVDVKNFSLASSNQFIIQGLNQSYFSAILPTENGGAWGMQVTAQTSEKMERRTEFQPGGTGEYFYASSIAAGAAYGKTLSDKFSFGIQIKYIQERLAEYIDHSAAIDLGFLYRTDFKALQFAILLQNFGTNSSLSGDFLELDFNRSNYDLSSNSPATVFKLGMSMRPLEKGDHVLITGIQLNHPNDNAENIRLGLEYMYREFLFLRGGYKLNVLGQTLPSFGAGLKTRIGKHPLRIDYAINPTNFLGIQHSAGISFTLNNTGRDEE